MRRTDRLFEIIQILRRADGPMRAADLADALGVSVRTVYRCIATLQGLRVPIDGEAGIGYVMRPGYDLPPVNLDADEREAIVIGLGLLSRTGDAGLSAAASRVLHKLDGTGETLEIARRLAVSDWGIGNIPEGRLEALRRAVREDLPVTFSYLSLSESRSRRAVSPLALTYYAEVAVFTGHCHLRGAERSFRVDRMEDVTLGAATPA